MSSPFMLDPDIIYLNHAAVAPWPRAAYEAVTAFAKENASRGAADYPRWLQLEQDLREQLRRLINAESSDDIALLKSTSEGLSFIAAGLDWQPGDSIVIPSAEFPSNRMVWEMLQAHDVELRQVDISASDDPESALLAAVDDTTRLLACSSVQYTTGLRLDLDRLGAGCKQQDILFCVDAIQSLGVVPFDVKQCQADFVVADGHKWMTGPEGLALFYCRPGLRAQLRLTEFGWHMMEHPHDFKQKQWQPAASAQRFECGSPNMLGAVALNASLGVLLDQGIDNIHHTVLGLTGKLMTALDEIENITVLTRRVDERRAGIVLFHIEGREQQTVYQTLMQKQVICAARGAGVRFSPHFYTTESDLDEAITRLLQSI